MEQYEKLESFLKILIFIQCFTFKKYKVYNRIQYIHFIEILIF